jgi:hypothetical protein
MALTINKSEYFWHESQSSVWEAVVRRYISMTNLNGPFYEIVVREKKFLAIIQSVRYDRIEFLASSIGKLSVFIWGVRLRKLSDELYSNPVIMETVDGYYNGDWEAKRQSVLKKLLS